MNGVEVMIVSLHRAHKLPVSALVVRAPDCKPEGLPHPRDVVEHERYEYHQGRDLLSMYVCVCALVYVNRLLTLCPPALGQLAALTHATRKLGAPDGKNILGDRKSVV